MGKKSKNKNKVSGATKTAAKTEKKLISKMKKELAAIGEDDIDKVLAEIEREDAKRNALVEKVLEGTGPDPRAFATLVPHPTNAAELIMFGGEYHNGQKTIMYSELLFYSIPQNEWRSIRAPPTPPPRSAHQAVTTAANKGELWIFGGEFTSPSESQFHHYRDLWKYSISEKKWEKIKASGGPSGRSGHRMVILGRKLVIFGGYTDNGRDYRYHNDVHTFCLDNRVWSKIEPSGKGPTARSGCVMVPAGTDSIYIYGGYSRSRVGRTEVGMTHRDAYRLTCSESGEWKWREANSSGAPFRSGLSAAANVQQKRAYVFGGSVDIEETEEQLKSEMSNQLLSLDMDSNRWYDVTVRKIAAAPKSSEPKTDEGECSASQPEAITIKTDDVFTMTLGGAASPSCLTSDSEHGEAEVLGPSARMNSALAVQRSTLYVYGGLLEKGDKQFTLSDMHSLDLHKMNEWKTILEQPKLPEWLGSDSEDEWDSETGSGSDEGSDDSSEESD